jgi:hypothetical protein
MPTVPVVIKVIAAQAGLVRLGIEAPAYIPVLRDELCRDGRAVEAPPEGAPPSARHMLRHRLNNLTLGLARLRGLLGAGCGAAVGESLDELAAELEALQGCVRGDLPEAPRGARPECTAAG